MQLSTIRFREFCVKVLRLPKKKSPEASGILQNLAPATQNHDMQKNSECLQNDAASCSNLLKTSSKFTKHCGLAIQCYLRRDRLSLTHTCQRSLALCTKNYACQRAKKCPKPCSCHTKRGSDPDLLCLHKKHIVSQTDTARR